MYAVELIGCAVFAMTGVLAVSRRGLDLIGALMLGAVTAVGGGTIRDLLMRYPIFWFGDVNYLWAALTGAILAFYLTTRLRNVNRGLLYLDGLDAKETGDITGLSPGAVATKIHRIKALLARRFNTSSP